MALGQQRRQYPKKGLILSHDDPPHLIQNLMHAGNHFIFPGLHCNLPLTHWF